VTLYDELEYADAVDGHRLNVTCSKIFCRLLDSGYATAHCVPNSVAFDWDMWRTVSFYILIYFFALVIRIIVMHVCVACSYVKYEFVSKLVFISVNPKIWAQEQY